MYWLQAFGAKLVLTPATKGMGGAVAKAEAIVAELGENAFMLQQFNNPDNPKVFERTPSPRPPLNAVWCISRFFLVLELGDNAFMLQQLDTPDNPKAASCYRLF